MMEHLPIEIVLVRHGEAEGNLAHSQSQKGDDSLWTPEFMVWTIFKLLLNKNQKARHTSSYRLTDRGREEAKIAGDYIRENITEQFDQHFVSEYIR